MRSYTRSRTLLLLLVSTQFACLGCTHAQLRRSTVVHSMTLSDVYTQQVLNNLAMFVSNPHALPFFAYPNQGTTEIQDAANLGGPGFSRGVFKSADFGLGASRQATENWVLVPLSDPAKLGLMRCAYQQAIAPCIGMDLVAMSDCPSCKGLRTAFHGSARQKVDDVDGPENLPCLNGSCWFCSGCKRDVPKNCGAPYVGIYGDVCVWVPPEGREMLTRLTLTILDYAVNDSKQFNKRTKNVELYINADHSINFDGKGIKISATIPIDVPSKSIATLDQPAYGEFLARYGKPMADRMEIEAEKMTQGKYSMLSHDQKREYWSAVNPEKGWPIEMKPAVQFIKDHQVLPWLIPNEDVLHGPALYERKGSASDGLQQLGQRLSAASPSTPGH